jgi:predicted DNA-binding transcriptional regulator AlpA
MEEKIMIVKEVVDYLQMDGHTVYKFARSGQVPVIKIAGQWGFKKDVIDRWIEENSLKKINGDQ